MRFLGLGTGLGSAMIVDGIIEPMELGHLPYKTLTYEEYVGKRAFERAGKRKWQRNVAEVVAYLTAALEPEDVVLVGGNVKQLEKLPPGCRAGDNANAFARGFRLWDDDAPGGNPANVQRSNRPPAPRKFIQRNIHKSGQGTEAWQQ